DATVAVASDDPALTALEVAGVAARIAVDGVPHWIHRRWLHRHLREQRERRRSRVEPVSMARFWRFLTRWQGVHPAHRRSGPGGAAETLAQLAGLELPAATWTSQVLPGRLEAFQPALLDELTLG